MAPRACPGLVECAATVQSFLCLAIVASEVGSRPGSWAGHDVCFRPYSSRDTSRELCREEEPPGAASRRCRRETLTSHLCECYDLLPVSCRTCPSQLPGRQLLLHHCETEGHPSNTIQHKVELTTRTKTRISPPNVNHRQSAACSAVTTPPSLP